jgi:hypothetical protein
MHRTFMQYIRGIARGPKDVDGHVHFHRGPSGAPAVCHDAGCDQPRLSV